MRRARVAREEKCDDFLLSLLVRRLIGRSRGVSTLCCCSGGSGGLFVVGIGHPDRSGMNGAADYLRILTVVCSGGY